MKANKAFMLGRPLDVLDQASTLEGWTKGVLRPFPRIIRLYRNSNHRRNEMKDEWSATLTTTPRGRDFGRRNIGNVGDEALLLLSFRHFTYKEISGFIKKSHGVTLSPNAISKRLKRLGSPSRKGSTIHGENEIKRVIEELLPNIPDTVGYRCMTNMLRLQGFHVRRNTIMKLMKEVNPEGVSFRRRRRIERRVYRSFGPNHIWHVDGYDKLKPFGFGIHGCIDGFSRKIMWLNAASSNSDPAIIASYYLSCVDQIKGCPLILQSDPGTENTIMGALQCVFRHDANDNFSGLNSYRVVRSIFNQRIEAWWSMLKRRLSQWWITFLNDLERDGMFHRGNVTETRCLRYCFMPFLQNELEKIADEWNCHRVSYSRSAVLPGGRPDVLYNLCETSGGKDCLENVCDEDIEWAKSLCLTPTRSGSREFDTLACSVFERNGMYDSYNWQDALSNFNILIQEDLC